MNFEISIILMFAAALAVFMYARRRVIVDLKAEIEELRRRADKLNDIATRQRQEIQNLMATAAAERRARQLATLGTQPAQKAPPAPPERRKVVSMPRKQEEATRHVSAPVNTWDVNSQSFAGVPIESSAPAERYQGNGGTFDGGGASGDYIDSATSCDSSSSSSDSGSSSSSDSACSSSSSD